MFDNIISATDLVEVEDAPVTVALAIARQNQGRLHILHVLESASSKNRRLVKHFITGQELESNPDYEKEVSEAITHTYADHLKAYPNYEVNVTAGYPFEEILAQARRVSADLMVVGPHSTRAKAKGVVRVKGKVGSTAEGVIINECCPVMIVNRPLPPEMLQFKKLVLGMDFSRSCLRALRYALKLARVYGSKIFAYNMLPVPPTNRYTQAIYQSELNIAQKRLDAICREIPPEVGAECEVWGGVHPHLEILKYADKKQADTIIMGSHTKDDAGKWYVGSAVERVSYRSPAPVIVITDPAGGQNSS